MAIYRRFLDSSSELQIEVRDEGTGLAVGGGYVSGLVDALEQVASRAAEELAQLPEEQRPAELTVAFGLAALDSGGFAIALGDGGASFRVSMRWDLGRGSGGDLSGFPQLPGLGPGGR